MFVIAYVSTALLLVTGWLICRERYVDDEVPGLFGDRAPGDGDAVVEVAGAEPAVVLREG